GGPTVRVAAPLNISLAGRHVQVLHGNLDRHAGARLLLPVPDGTIGESGQRVSTRPPKLVSAGLAGEGGGTGPLTVHSGQSIGVRCHVVGERPSVPKPLSDRTPPKHCRRPMDARAAGRGEAAGVMPREGLHAMLLPVPPTGLADGFGREDGPTARRVAPWIHPSCAWFPGSREHDSADPLWSHPRW
ncbi:MAG: hypothetical protein JWR37_6031, partial [Mycobacterium sp.]|nr:hypothetical protein [Mycobacterium sp.]